MDPRYIFSRRRKIYVALQMHVLKKRLQSVPHLPPSHCTQISPKPPGATQPPPTPPAAPPPARAPGGRAGGVPPPGRGPPRGGGRSGGPPQTSARGNPASTSARKPAPIPASPCASSRAKNKAPTSPP